MNLWFFTCTSCSRLALTKLWATNVFDTQQFINPPSVHMLACFLYHSNLTNQTKPMAPSELPENLAMNTKSIREILKLAQVVSRADRAEPSNTCDLRLNIFPAGRALQKLQPLLSNKKHSKRVNERFKAGQLQYSQINDGPKSFVKLPNSSHNSHKSLNSIQKHNSLLKIRKWVESEQNVVL